MHGWRAISIKDDIGEYSVKWEGKWGEENWYIEGTTGRQQLFLFWNLTTSNSLCSNKLATLKATLVQNYDPASDFIIGIEYYWYRNGRGKWGAENSGASLIHRRQLLFLEGNYFSNSGITFSNQKQLMCIRILQIDHYQLKQIHLACAEKKKK